MNSCVISDPLKHLGFPYEVNRYDTRENGCSYKRATGS